MDAVIKDLWLNIRTLTSTQWIIVCTFSLFIGFGLFAIFRWLYSSRFEAQKSLLELQDQTIEYYAALLNKDITQILQQGTKGEKKGRERISEKVDR